MSEQRIEFIRMLAVCKATGLCRAQIDLLVRQKKFPPKVKLGRATAFVRHEVDQWLNERMADRNV